MIYINMQKEVIFAIIIGVILIYLIISYYYRPHYSEGFSPYESSNMLNQYYDPNEGIKDYEVDTMVCSKKCCGDTWPTPFDGLSSFEIQQSIATMGSTGPFVRTNYTCANGIDGVGCPCISKKAYTFLVDHGTNAHTIQAIEPTFLIGGDGSKYHSYPAPYGPNKDPRPYNPPLSSVDQQSYGSTTSPTSLRAAFAPDQQMVFPTDVYNQEMTPYQTLQSERSMFVDSPKLNDLELGRTPNPVNNVQSCGARIQ
jgi:hypothetical protein